MDEDQMKNLPASGGRLQTTTMPRIEPAPNNQGLRDDNAGECLMSNRPPASKAHDTRKMNHAIGIVPKMLAGSMRWNVQPTVAVVNFGSLGWRWSVMELGVAIATGRKPTKTEAREAAWGFLRTKK